jgi:FtsP/CotA-like multicopper oxidase with cupredoxin domain
MSARFRSPLRLALLLLAGVVVLSLVAVTAPATVWTRAVVSTVGDIAFERPLQIPPLAASTTTADGERRFQLELQTGKSDLGLPGPTRTWGVNGPLLGPTLRASRGERVAVDVTNALPEATSLHWHGMHLPAVADGGPHQMIEPGSTWSPAWTIDQPAATLWYHPHPHERTAEHVRRGVAGLFLVDDPGTGVDLPDRYGVDDVPVLVQDASFDDDGQLSERQSWFSPTGPLGDTLLVNGTIGPYFEVASERVRLRLVNASLARVYDFGLATDGGDDQPMTVVGTDGGLLAEPVEADRVLLSPGERAEVVVEVPAGQRRLLRSHPTDLGADAWNERFAGGDDAFDVLELRAADVLAPAPEVVDQLTDVPDLAGIGWARSRRFELSGTSINGQRMDMSRIDAAGRARDVELWEVENADGVPHNFHVHGVSFQVVDVDDDRPPPVLGGWKDTVFVRPGSTVRLAVLMPGHVDPDVPFMFHCHLLQHEDRGMMGQFVVIGSGHEPLERLDGDSHRH